MKEISPESEQVLHYLKSARAENRVTPERPLSGTNIARKFGLSGNTETRQVIHELRVSGEWIGANAKGYYYALTWQEIAETVRSLDGRARSIAVVANAMKARVKFQKQTTLAL